MVDEAGAAPAVQPPPVPALNARYGDVVASSGRRVGTPGRGLERLSRYTGSRSR
jgi:hypothetical protein